MHFRTALAQGLSTCRARNGIAAARPPLPCPSPDPSVMALAMMPLATRPLSTARVALRPAQQRCQRLAVCASSQKSSPLQTAISSLRCVTMDLHAMTPLSHARISRLLACIITRPSGSTNPSRAGQSGSLGQPVRMKHQQRSLGPRSGMPAEWWPHCTRRRQSLRRLATGC